MGQLLQIEEQLIELGYQIIAVSADRPSKIRETFTKHGMHYQLFSDSSAAAARRFGIAFRLDSVTVSQYSAWGLNLEEASGERHHILPVPALFLVDTDNVIRFTYVNPDYRVRIHPEVLLARQELRRRRKNSTLSPFSRQVIDLIHAIPAGCVATYGQIATLAGDPRGARQVARILHSMSQREKLPWHRVVNQRGKISLRTGCGCAEQTLLLLSEGINFDADERIDLQKYLWRPRRE